MPNAKEAAALSHSAADARIGRRRAKDYFTPVIVIPVGLILALALFLMVRGAA